MGGRRVRRTWTGARTVGLTTGVVVTLLVLGWSVVPGLLGAGAARAATPVVPTHLAAYSWHTGFLTPGAMEAATLAYQNGAGVEFMDDPQAMLLSADGSTYRRLGRAEERSIFEDQGDPAVSVLSADGTFVVIGSADRTGTVEVLTLRDGQRRSVAIGAERAGLPLAIGSDGRTVLLATSQAVVDRYVEETTTELTRLDLATGQVRDYPQLGPVSAAALSPDGRRFAVVGPRGLDVVDADTVTVETSVVRGSAGLDGDAFSPDGRRLAYTVDGNLFVADLAADGAGPATTRGLHPQVDYARAIGWRDDRTVLVHGSTNGDANTSVLTFVDVAGGSESRVADYAPDFTGAGIYGADAARDLVARWQVVPRPVDRGPAPWAFTVGRAAAGGLVAGLLAAGLVAAVHRRRHAGPRRALISS